eukprot:TRINITY_DN5222_c0_g1_i6.p1 TRINITY_DN5222_c0_g1~~TRINITY_DN5222_c0_g1_i6.p1  ORF type:complete len:383 (-),score=64.43 TRINITY_DN5222_c0_g1_i6:718-1866(-)
MEAKATVEVRPPEDKMFDEVRPLLRYIESYERPVYCRRVYKINHRCKKQRRILLVTTLHLVNIDLDGFWAKAISIFNGSYQIKRRIPLSNIKAITISREGTEFVVHIPGEHDLRYSTRNKEEAILNLFAAIKRNDSTNSIDIYFKDDMILEQFNTSPDDAKRGASRKPTEKTRPMTLDLLSDTLEKIKNKRREDLRNTRTTRSIVEGEKVTLDDFVTLKVLGRGFFGKVLLVEKKSTGELYAMKTLTKENVLEADQLQYLQTERFLLEKVDHPFTVKLAYAFQTPDRLFFVMKFMRGGELLQHLAQSRRFDEERARFYAVEMILAIEYLHTLGVVYRDLKPENVLLDEEGHIGIIDFGISKILPENEKTYSFVGTAEYAGKS